MKYQIWDMVSYGHCEPLEPFTKIYESNELQDVITHLSELDNDKLLIITLENGQIIFNNQMKIYESPDGKIIYRRDSLSDKTIKIN